MASPSIAAQQILQNSTPAPKFAFTDFLKKEYRFGLDPNRKTCQFFLQGHCPMGDECPDKHSTAGGLVCKHWLRSLCKKSNTCEFLHEYNLRKMPECNFFLRNNYCSNGEECLYLHIDPESKLPPCPHYDRGFCPLGPNCSKKHVRKEICPNFLAGFCWEGRLCKLGAHPRWGGDLPPPTVRKPKEEREEERREIVEVRERGDRDREGGRGHDGGGGGGGGGRRFGGRRHWVDRGGRGRR